MLLPSLIVIVQAVMAGCSSKELALMPRDYRGSAVKAPDTTGKGRPDSLAGLDAESVYVSAVVAPQGYDWRQDSTFGNAPLKIILFKDFEEILGVDTGKDCLVSPDPDLHHIINGHLYTEYATASQTIVKKDGTELFRYEGREWLKGILPAGDSLYTLGQSREGKGFSFRLNGNPLLVKPDGTVRGGFGQRNFDGNGALYFSFDDICFDYLADNVTVHVCNGIDNSVNNGYSMRHFSQQVEESYYYYEFPSGLGEEVMCLSDGTMPLPSGIPEGAYYFFPTQGGYYHNGTMYLALTPRERGRKPFVWTGGACREIDINGFLTGIEVSGDATR